MRHARAQALDELEPFLGRLRAVPGLPFTSIQWWEDATWPTTSSKGLDPDMTRLAAYTAS